MATFADKKSSTSVCVSVAPSSSTTHASGRSDHLGCGTPITAASLIVGMRHQLVLELDRRDPLAARLDEVLGAVDKADPTLGVHRGDVAGAQPSVVGEAVASARIGVVRRRDPVAAALQFAARLTVPRHDVRRAGLDDAALNAEVDPPDRACARPPARRRAGSAASASRWHTAAIGLVSVIPQACRIGRPSCSRYASDSAFGTAEPPQGIARNDDVSRALQLGQDLHPDRRHACRDRDLLVDDQIGDAPAPTGRALASRASTRRQHRRGPDPTRWRGTSERPGGSRPTPERRASRP